MKKEKNFYRKLLTPLFLFMMAFALLTATKTDASAASKRPGVVKGLTAKPDYEYGGVKLSWKRASHAKSYEIYYKTSKKGKFKSLYPTSSRSRTISTSDLTPGKTCYFKVRAVNGNKTGKFSSVKAAKAVLETPSIYNGPYLKSENSVFLSFSFNSDYSYELYRSSSKNGKYKKIKTLSKKYLQDYYDNHGSSYTYIDKKLKPGQYFYKIKCYAKVKGKKVYSKFSSAESIVVPKKVTITMDNWSQYYEVAPSYELVVERNSFNEITDTYTRYCYALKLKDKYSCFNSSSDSKFCNSNVAFELEYTLNQRQASVDWNTGKITPGAIVPDEYNKYPYTTTETGAMTSYNKSSWRLSEFDAIYKDSENPVVETVENFNLKRIQGTLYLEKW
ncbi:MAG: fibronectin type III domain-containing protein [Lachnospiraceae bacterium]